MFFSCSEPPASLSESTVDFGLQFLGQKSRFRLDVSQYNVIRTIIIFHSTRRGKWVSLSSLHGGGSFQQQVRPGNPARNGRRASGKSREDSTLTSSACSGR